MLHWQAPEQQPHFMHQARGLVPPDAEFVTPHSEKTVLDLNNAGLKTPRPKEAQKAWMDLKFGMFIHFGINTYYGEVVELRFDGFWKRQNHGWTKKQDIDGEAGFQEKNHRRDLDFIHAWRMEGAYRWQMDHLYQFIKSMQPNCLVMNNATTSYPGVPLHPVDIRCGEKYTSPNKNDVKVWNWLNGQVYLGCRLKPPCR
jgi:alpha-L-fucosidase